ncbi:hypothetical protein TNCV_3690741, partial [Trichonephila clavipes]
VWRRSSVHGQSHRVAVFIRIMSSSPGATAAAFAAESRD